MPSEFAPHDLSSPTSHPPFVASCSSYISPYDGWYVFDGSTHSPWIGTHATGDWVQLDAGASYVLDSYQIATGSFNASWAPCNFTMSGSNDGTAWTTLDTRTGEHAWSTARTYTCNGGVTTAFRYFRLYISAIAATIDGGDARYTEVDELYLTGHTLTLIPQTITFPAIPDHYSTDAPFALAATSDSSLAVTYTVTSGPATILGNTVTLTGDGVVTIQATQAGNGTYAAATPVNQSFTVTSLLTAQTITFPTIPSHEDTDAPFTLAATSDSGLAVSYAVTAGPATVAGNTVTLTGAPGSVTIQATQAGNGTYAPATPVNQTFAVSALTAQTITFPVIGTHHPTDAPFVLAATASSGLVVSYAVTAGPATISGSTVTLTGGLGNVTIQATQAGNGTYSAATSISRTFTVSALTPAITFPVIAAIPPYKPPAYIVGGAVGISSIVSHGGSLYIAATVSTGVSSVCNIYRSNNQGATWVVVDGAHSPSVQSGVVSIGTVSLTFLYTPYGTNGPLQFQDFNLATQTWGAVYGATGPNATASAILLIRSNGDKVVIVGSTPTQAYVYAGGVWSAPIDLTTLFPVGWPTFAYLSACIDTTDTIHILGYVHQQVPPYGQFTFYEQLLSSNALSGFQDLSAIAYQTFGSPVICGNYVAIGAIDAAQTYGAVLTGTPLAAPVFTLTNCDPSQPIPYQNLNNPSPFVATDGTNLWAYLVIETLTLVAPWTYLWKTQSRLSVTTPSSLAWSSAGVFEQYNYPTSGRPFSFYLMGMVGNYPWMIGTYFPTTGPPPDAYFLSPYSGVYVTTNSGGGGGGSAGGRCAPCATSRHASILSRDRSTS